MSTLTPSRPLVIGIAGCTCTGKSTLSAELARRLDATVFPLDFYYRDLSQFPLDSRDKRNFDHPDSLESELIIEHVRGLANGEPINRPVYNFKTHSRVDDTFDVITPPSAVIVEGLLALYYPELLPLYHFSIYITAPDEVCLQRRIVRDMRERNRTEENVRAQFEGTTKPMADLYVLPSAARATITVEGIGSLDRSIEQVLKRLHQLGLMPNHIPNAAL